MVLKPEPIFECVESLPPGGWVILLDPRGKSLNQKMVRKLARRPHLVLIAGHYEGVDYRVHEHLVDEEISLGDFITMGGEAPALCLIEAVIRLLPGVLGNEESLKDESFQNGWLEYPQYTKPRIYRHWKVPEVLLSGDHKAVARWRLEKAKELTAKRRPDLLRKV